MKSPAVRPAPSPVLAAASRSKWVSPRLSLGQNELRLPGVCQNNVRIGQAAAAFVISMLHGGERGIPVVSPRILVESTWNPGETPRPQGARKTARRK